MASRHEYSCSNRITPFNTLWFSFGDMSTHVAKHSQRKRIFRTSRHMSTHVAAFFNVAPSSARPAPMSLAALARTAHCRYSHRCR